MTNHADASDIIMDISCECMSHAGLDSRKAEKIIAAAMATRDAELAAARERIAQLEAEARLAAAENREKRMREALTELLCWIRDPLDIPFKTPEQKGAKCEYLTVAIATAKAALEENTDG